MLSRFCRIVALASYVFLFARVLELMRLWAIPHNADVKLYIVLVGSFEISRVIARKVIKAKERYKGMYVHSPSTSNA